ncbi:Serine/threonine-protein phosphatase 6 regulatory subunit 2 [Orchesella cincta]|uniref:Serine/threonine-protein phosphatase 6 regulatory subunit 2 n=1 Tax=Orchesella cincta TaxID=48709 RepID=A0A1D2MMT1_ORCCI|nr:Serine/threonine-protein phosphatase 6 regulatory subunit 2 [Orchesella cincta]
MVDLITTVPSADIPLPLQYKYPNTACEVLTSDISFADKIAAEHTLMGKLFHFFRDSEPPLNPLLASYVSRVLGEMIARKLDQNWYSYQLNLIQVMGYLQSDPSLLDWLLKHLETSAVCDFLHKLVMHVEGQDMRANLYEVGLIAIQFSSTCSSAFMKNIFVHFSFTVVRSPRKVFHETRE